MKEIPMISTTMWVKDSIHDVIIASKLSNLLAKRNDEFTPTIFDAYSLSKKRRAFNSNNEEQIALFESCIANKEENTITLTNSDRKKREVLFGFTIDVAYFATVITFEVTHSYFKSDVEKQKYMDIVKQLIEIVNPLYARTDDIGNSLEILDKAGEETYICVTDHIPAIFWGNYFGEKYVEYFGKEKLLNSPCGIVEPIGKGILIAMSNDPMNFCSKECLEARKKLGKYLNVAKTNPIKRIFGM